MDIMDINVLQRIMKVQERRWVGDRMIHDGQEFRRLMTRRVKDYALF